MDRQRLFDDMDSWGYSFRLSSAKRWFEQDGEDALDWLRAQGLADAAGAVGFRLREESA